MNNIKALLILIATTTIYISCTKDDSVLNPDPETLDSATIMGFKDSTQLIKSIRYNSYDSATNLITDSFISYYYYDTLNRKIIIKLKDYSDPEQALRDSFEYSYNYAGLIINVVNKSSESSSTIFSLIREDYMYDTENIVKKVTSKFSDGTTLTYNLNKTSLANGGYSLKWHDLINAPDTAYYTVNFDKNSRLNSFYFWGHFDSLEYDAGGNIRRIWETDYLHPYDPIEASTFLRYDFVSRETKGDQLYNLERILLNGISQFPAETSFGVLSEFEYQYTKYPALSTKIQNPANGNYYPGKELSLINFTSHPEFDNTDRLKKYKVFFNDSPFTYMEYVISYYK